MVKSLGKTPFQHLYQCNAAFIVYILAAFKSSPSGGFVFTVLPKGLTVGLLSGEAHNETLNWLFRRVTFHVEVIGTISKLSFSVHNMLT